MGKKGAAMRAAKMQNTTYSFTAAQLEEHDKMILREFRQRVVDDVSKQADEIFAEREKAAMQAAVEEWEKREKAFSENHPNDNAVSCVSLLMATTARVLVERFGWKPIPKDGNYDRRNRLVQFCEAVTDEVYKITDPDNADILKYCDETYDLYGVRFNTTEK